MYYYQILKVIGKDEDGEEILDFEAPYMGKTYDDQQEAQRVIDHNSLLKDWRVVDIEEF